ncbi:MAG: hypothetical protein IKT54_01690 [Clostridia bacterium]|nr:hypothetical protein [Clostridia bacterium]
MLEIIKKNSSFIFKMIVNQIALTVFGLVLSVATYQNKPLHVFTGIFAIGFYLVLLYTMSWEAGIADKVRVDAKRIPYQPYKFAIISLAANSLNILLALVATICWAFNSFSYYLSNEGAYNIYRICNAIGRFIHGMYASSIALISPDNPLLLFPIILPAIIACTYGYFLGVNGKTIRHFFGIKTAYDNLLNDTGIHHENEEEKN